MLFLLSVTIINCLQLKLSPFNYEKGDLIDTAYSVNLIGLNIGFHIDWWFKLLNDNW